MPSDQARSARRALADLRRRVRDKLGHHLARKASDTLVRALARPRPERALAEAVPVTGAVSAILEFKGHPEPAGGPVSGPATGFTPSSRGVEAVPAARSAARWAAINRLRDEFQKEAVTIRGELERRTISKVALETMTPGAMRGAVQLAWLIRAIRAPLNPKVLAEVAAAREIARIDLPRRLAPDIDGTCSLIGAPALRVALGATGKGIVVAVIDSEVLVTHRAFGGRVIQKENYTLEPFGTPDDHGTAVAGIIASADPTFTGVAPDALIHNYKVLATDPASHGDDFAGALAIQRALEDGAQIANCSWGAGPATDGSSREARACDAAWDLGLTIVKSAGNRGPAANTMTTPADARGVIVVGATARDGRELGQYSSRGPAAKGRRPDLVAPGGSPAGGIRSAQPNGRFGDCGVGTSLAAPHVTGLLAVLLEREPLLTPDQLKARLLEKCTPLAALTENDQGAGLVGFA